MVAVVTGSRSLLVAVAAARVVIVRAATEQDDFQTLRNWQNDDCLLLL